MLDFTVDQTSLVEKHLAGVSDICIYNPINYCLVLNIIPEVGVADKNDIDNFTAQTIEFTILMPLLLTEEAISSAILTSIPSQASCDVVKNQ